MSVAACVERALRAQTVFCVADRLSTSSELTLENQNKIAYTLLHLLYLGLKLVYTSLLFLDKIVR